MTFLFQKIFSWGIAGTWPILAVLFLRLIFGRMSRRYICILWILAGVNLMVPFVINPFRVVPADLPLLLAAQGEAVTEAETEKPALPAAEPDDIVSDERTTPETAKRQSIFYWEIGSRIWLVGMAFLLLYGLVGWIRIRSRLKVSLRNDKGVWLCDAIEEPFVFGLIHPRIYLPSGIKEEYREYILCHERCHIKRGDPITRLIAYGILAVYWFHPLVWAGYVCFCRDTEFACDESTAGNMPQEKKKKYLQVLLSCTVSKAALMIPPVSMGGVSVKSRVFHVLRYKKIKVKYKVLMTVLAFQAVLLFWGSSVKTGRQHEHKAADVLLSFGIDNLDMDDTMVYPEEMVLNKGSDIHFHVTYMPMALELEIELLSDSEEKETIKINGGTGSDIFRIKADGTYKIAVRNRGPADADRYFEEMELTDMYGTIIFYKGEI